MAFSIVPASKKSVCALAVAASFCSLHFAASTFAQPSTTPTQQTSSQREPPPVADKAKAMATRPAEPPPVLQQLNTAIEQLTARISPAVVQILVTGYGAVEDNSRGQTALVSRERAIGSE